VLRARAALMSSLNPSNDRNYAITNYQLRNSITVTLA
jgi:hypothetical protein